LLGLPSLANPLDGMKTRWVFIFTHLALGKAFELYATHPASQKPGLTILGKAFKAP